MEEYGKTEIELKEVAVARENMKKKKASGEDGIPNEAWIYGGLELEEYTLIINEIWMAKELPEE